MQLASLLIAVVLGVALPAQELADRLDALCQPLIDAQIAVGFVVGVIDGDDELVRGYGLLERGAADVPSGGTLYEIGSISKVFTGLLLADAVSRGRCTLDDPLQDHLPDGVVAPTWDERPILLRHLATHSSGLPRLPDMTGSDRADPYAHFDEARVLAALGATELRRPPGTDYEYSNFGVGLLGLVLARIGGEESYEALLRKRVTGPLGMDDTVLSLNDELAARLAPAHDVDLESAQPWDLAALAGAGGIRSTVHDMLRFARLQLAPGDAELAAAVELSQHEHFTTERGVKLGLGWHFARDGITLCHSGQTGGYHAWLGVVPSRGYAVCLLANTATGSVDLAAERVLQHLFGMDVQPPDVQPPMVLEPAELQRLVGKYRMAVDVTFDISLRPRGLFAQLTGQRALRLYPRSATEFAYRAVDASITFEIAEGEVTALVLHQNGRDRRCERM